MTKPGLRSDKQLFIFCLQQQMVPSLNDDSLANGHVSTIGVFFIAHTMGDIEHLCLMIKRLWALPPLSATAKAPIFRLVPFSKSCKCLLRTGAKVQSNVRCVLWFENSLV